MSANLRSVEIDCFSETHAPLRAVFSSDETSWAFAGGKGIYQE
jgi:hypothetical protein